MPLHQRGIALLLALVLLVVLGGWLLTAMLSTSQAARERDRLTSEALAAAKRALIAYAASFAEIHSVPPSGPFWVPGSLPCPELTAPATPDAEGRSASLPCGAASTNLLGRLPWAELRIEAPKDGAGQCLWYAVSGTFKRKNTPPTTTMLNWDTAGPFDILQADATTATPVYLAGPDSSERAVAVVIAPGTPQSNKSPTPHVNAPVCRGSYVASDYLDVVDGVDNAAAPGATASFVVAQPSGTFNDRVVYITAREIFSEIERQQNFKLRIREMMRHAADCIAGFAKYHQTSVPGDERLPWAMPLALGSLSAYGSNANYRDGIGLLSGRLPWDVRRSCDAVLGFSCPTIERQLLDNSLYCSTTQWSTQDTWWYQNWKDQLFYAIGSNHRPDASVPTSACPTCLQVNGAGTYAAALLFSSNALTGKRRSDLAQKSDISNYLEGRNAANHPNSGGDGNYESSPVSANFNDVVVCIDDQLNVVDPC